MNEKNVKPVLLVVCVLLAGLTAPAGAAVATPIRLVTAQPFTLPFNAGDPDFEPAFAYDPYASLIYAGSNRGGFFRSDNGGRSWTRADDGSFMASAVDLRNEGRFAMSLKKGVIKAIKFNGENPSEVYLLTEPASSLQSEAGQRLWFSGDGGGTFEPAAYIPGGNRWKSFAVNATRLCGLTDEGLLCSTDKGTAWSAVRFSYRRVPGQMPLLSDLSFAPDGKLVVAWDDAIYVFRPDLKTFDKIRLPSPNFRQVIFHPARTFPVYLAGIDGNSSPLISVVDERGGVSDYRELKPRHGVVEAVDFHRSIVLMKGEGGYFRLALDGR